jgi:hypothetical protein
MFHFRRTFSHPRVCATPWPRKAHPPLKIAALATLVSVTMFAAPAFGIAAGQPVADALEELRREGLRLIYSSALIPRTLLVRKPPADGPLAEQARQLLHPHDLDLREIGVGRFVVVRRAPESASTASTDEATRAAEPAPRELQTVNVYASRYQIEQQPTLPWTELTSANLEVLPALNQDAMRAVKHLPGTSSGLSARSHVRGGREDELAVYFDGVPLHEPFHFKDYQGLLGVVDPGALSSLDLFSGVLPARHGNALSGVLELHPRRWSGGAHHELGGSVLQHNALSQGRLGKQPVEWLVTARRSTLTPLVRVLGARVVDPRFLDFLGRLQVSPGEHTQLVFGHLWADDDLQANPDEEQETASTSFRDGTAWLSWQQEWTPQMASRLLVAHTSLETRRDGRLIIPQNTDAFLNEQRKLEATDVRAELSRLNASGSSWTLGADWTHYAADLDLLSTAQFDPLLARALNREPGYVRDLEIARDGATLSAYGSSHWRISTRWAADIGLRWDSHAFGAVDHGSHLSPRLSVEYRRSSDTVVRIAAGSQTQTQRPHELRIADGETRLGGEERAHQMVVGLEHRWSDALDLRIEAYAKRIADPAPYYENLFDPVTALPELGIDRVRIDPDRTHMHGVETSLQWRNSATWGGWLSYTWAEAEDTIDGQHVPRTWVPEHTLRGGVTWTRGAWTATAAATLRSGWRMTPLNDSAVAPERIAVGDRNSDQWPTWFNIDLRGTWERPLPIGSLQLFVEVINPTNRRTYCCQERASSPGVGSLGRSRPDGLPRYPFVGLKWAIDE